MLICFCCITKFNHDSDMCWDEKKYRKKKRMKNTFFNEPVFCIPNVPKKAKYVILRWHPLF